MGLLAMLIRRMVTTQRCTVDVSEFVMVLPSRNLREETIPLQRKARMLLQKKGKGKGKDKGKMKGKDKGKGKDKDKSQGTGKGKDKGRSRSGSRGKGQDAAGQQWWFAGSGYGW